MRYGTIKNKPVETSLTPLAILRRIKGERMPFFLDSAKGDKKLGNKSYLGCNPRETLKSRGSEIVVEGRDSRHLMAEDPLGVLRELLDKYPKAESSSGLTCGAVGCLSYDFAAHNLGINFTNEKPAEVWDLFFGIYTSVLEWDTGSGKYTLHYLDETEVGFWEKVLSEDLKAEEDEDGWEKRLSGLIFPEEDLYYDGFRKIKEHIRKGDVYEVNLSQCFEARDTADPVALYTQLRKKNPADFMTYMDFGPYQVLSSSPERLFECRSRVVTTRPIKGTIARGKTAEEDLEARETLIHSEKDISELLMIVDLMRNDLSLSCIPESVRVDEMYRLESYANVHHLVSTIEGRLREGEDAISLMRHVFPGGSITGAPKRAAVEVIEEVEAFSRGIYTGSLGYFSLNGDADFNILIRTILKQGDRCCFYGGGAITWDSDEEVEYDETIAKSSPLIDLFTTLDDEDEA